MFVDYRVPTPNQNAQWDGGVGVLEQGVGRTFDTGLRRPYYDKYDRPCVTVNTGRYTTEKGVRVPIRERRLLRDLIVNGVVPPVFNATALRKEEWIELDRVVLRAARYRLRAYGDLAASNSFGGFNGMAKMILEHETMSDPGEAIVDMDALTDGRTDAPIYQLQGLPLPITHSDFFFSSRTLALGRNSGTPLDMTMGEAAGRRIGEAIEKTTIGNQQGITYGGASTQQGGYGRNSTVYGYLTFPARLTKNNFTWPSDNGWTPNVLQQQVNSALNQLRAAKFFGPYMIYTSNDWDPYLDGDYYVAITSGAVAPTKTLRQRLKDIGEVQDIRRLDFLFATVPPTSTTAANYTGPGGENVISANPFTLIFVQMTSEVARAVNGMDITTVQWESVGGMRVNFKVMCIQVPQIRADYYNNCGILIGTGS